MARGPAGPAYLVRFKAGDLAWLYDGKVRWRAPYLEDLIEGPIVAVRLDYCWLGQR